MFRRALTKDLANGSKLFIGSEGVAQISDEEFEKFFSAEEKDIIKAARENGQIVKTHTISDSTVDRHGDTVNVDGWNLKHYSGVVLLNHGHIGFAGVKETTLPVAKSIKQWKYGGKLKSTATFTPKSTYPFGHMVGELVDQGFLPGVSVGFIPEEYEINEERGDYSYDFKSQELIEYSVVQVGSNRNALVEESFHDKIEEAFSGAQQAGIDTTAVAEEMSRILDEDKPETLREFCERLYMQHKSGIFHPVTQSPDRTKGEDDFLADIQEMFNHA